MRVALVLLALAAVTAAGEPRVSLELQAEPAEVYVQQPVRLTLRIRYSRAFLAKSAVQLFQQKLDLPVHVEAEGWTVAVSQDKGVSLALNDDVVHAKALEEQDGFAVVELTRTLLPDAPGELVLPAPSLRFAWGTEFRDDFLHGRVATDRRDEVVSGQPRTVRVLPIPTEGRPASWTGAVGQIELAVAVSRTELEEGETLELRLTLGGSGNLDEVPMPVLTDLGLKGFHVEGSLRAESVFTYTLRPLDAAVTELPALALPYFDPSPPAQFRFARCQPIPITVRALPQEQTPTDAVPEESHLVPGWLIGAAAAVLIAVAVFAWRTKRRVEAGPSDAFVRFQTESGDDLANALADYLATQLGCPRAAVIAPDLKDRLVERGIDKRLAAEAADRMARLVDARYGGGDPTDPTLQSADDLVRTLESAFTLLEQRNR